MPGKPGSDVETGRNQMRPLNGFPSLADFIASDPDRTSLVFRRFDRLAARNLLYLQSELADLEATLEQFDAEDQSTELGDADTQECAKSWELFHEAAEDPNNIRQKARMELVLKVRHKLKEYREALIFESTLASLGPPPVRTFDAINHAATRYDDTLKQREPIMIGTSARLYTTNEDLVVLKQAEFEDRLTSFVQRYLPVFFMAERRDNNMAYIPEKRIARFVAILSIVITVGLLFVAILALYYISNPTVKLIMVGVFMLLFASSVGLFTTAKRSEVFAATAAYAAVLVVFVSGNLGSDPWSSGLWSSGNCTCRADSS